MENYLLLTKDSDSTSLLSLLDISVAFDTIDHCILLVILHQNCCSILSILIVYTVIVQCWSIFSLICMEAYAVQIAKPREACLWILIFYINKIGLTIQPIFHQQPLRSPPRELYLSSCTESEPGLRLLLQLHTGFPHWPHFRPYCQKSFPSNHPPSWWAG